MTLAARIRAARELRWAGRSAEVAEVVGALLPEAEADGGALLVDALVELGRVSFGSPHAERALQLAQALGDRRRLVEAATLVADFRMQAGHLRAAAEALAVIEDPESDAVACVEHAELALYRGDLAEAVRWAARAERLAVSLADPPRGMVLARAVNQRATAAELSGDRAAAHASYERARDLLAGSPYGARQLAVSLNGLGSCAAAEGALEAAAEWHAAAARTFPAPIFHLNHAYVELRRGRLDETRRILAVTPSRRGLHGADVAADLLRAVCAADARDPAAFEAAARRFVRGGAGLRPHVDVALVARRAARDAARLPGWADRAVTFARVAHAVWRELGDATEGEIEAQGLRRLADVGARPPVGPFRMERVLARGGFGEVWRARHALSGVPVAVKVFRRGTVRADALDVEVRAMAALDHPHVVRVLDHGTVDGAAACMTPALAEGAP